MIRPHVTLSVRAIEGWEGGAFGPTFLVDPEPPGQGAWRGGAGPFLHNHKSHKSWNFASGRRPTTYGLLWRHKLAVLQTCFEQMTMLRLPAPRIRIREMNNYANKDSESTSQTPPATQHVGPATARGFHRCGMPFVRKSEHCTCM